LAIHNICHFPDWSILTLNYDELLDLGFRMVLGFQPSPVQYIAWRSLTDDFIAERRSSLTIPSGIYLKLHGSLDIYECQNRICGTARRLYRACPDDGILSVRLQDERPRCPACGVEGAEFIVPPGRNKTQNERAFDSLVFQLAEQALRTADRWLLLGYSFPDYDHDTIGLLTRALPSDRPLRIDVINPDAVRIGQRVAETLNRPVNTMAESFSTFAERMWEHIGVSPPTDGIPLA